MIQTSRNRTPLWRGVSIVAATMLAAACGPSRTEPPSPVPVPPQGVRADTIAPPDVPLPTVSARFAYAPGAYRYQIVTESEIRQRDDSASRNARIRTETVATLLIAPLAADSLHVDLTIDSVLAERDSLIPAPATADSMATAPVRFTAVIDARGLRLDQPPASGGPCTGDEALLGAARDLVFAVPEELNVGARWSDTSTVTLCRGGVPVTTGVVRDYEVTGAHRDVDGVPVVRLARRTTFSFAGTQTTTYGQVVALTGSGQSQALLDLDPAAGIVRALTGEGTSEVTVTYGRTSTPFTQNVVQRVTLAP